VLSNTGVRDLNASASGIDPTAEHTEAALATGVFWNGDHIGRFVTDLDGVLLAANDVGRGVLSAGDTIFLDEGRLRARAPDDQAALLDGLARGHRRATTYLMHGEPPCAPLVLQMVRRTHDGRGLSLLKAWRAECMGFVRLRPVAEALGLTEKQQRVVFHLVRGVDPEGVARRMGISVQTARTHIRNIYARLGVSSRAELFQIVCRYSSFL
jgi:DNA-binding CsgD family transcriptional regulator